MMKQATSKINAIAIPSKIFLTIVFKFWFDDYFQFKNILITIFIMSCSL